MTHPAARQRVVTWSIIIGYAVVVSGLPLPAGLLAPAASSPAAAKRLAAKDRSTPFPCMDKPCGCVTAEQCFTSCCCSTPSETLAWARAHDLEPAVIAALQRRAATAPPRADNSCCAASQKMAPAGCCAEASAAATAECCAAASQPACCAAQTHADPADEPMSCHTVSLRAMLACGGIVAQWLASVVAVPAPVPTACAVAMPLRASVETTDTLPVAMPVAPDVPPPRAA